MMNTFKTLHTVQNTIEHWSSKLSLFVYIKVADKFTVLVEAIDHGEVVKLSSSTTVIVHVQDGNNNWPTITGQTVGS